MPQSPTDQTRAAVEVRNLVIRYGELLAVDDVSFSANSGEITVVLGPNGAGKTSTIEHLEGFRPAASGSAKVLGLDPLADHGRLSSRVGIMLQSGGIPTAIRPYELLRQYSGFFENPLDPEILLGMVGLEGRRATPYRRLSGGEQQRLSLALALIGQPELVFLDEPTAGVDLAGRDLIRSVVLDLRSRGVCVVVTTHDLADAENLADRVVIFDQGRIVANGTPSELMSKESSDELLFATSAGLDVAQMRHGHRRCGQRRRTRRVPSGRRPGPGARSQSHVVARRKGPSAARPAGRPPTPRRCLPPSDLGPHLQGPSSKGARPMKALLAQLRTELALSLRQGEQMFGIHRDTGPRPGLLLLRRRPTDRYQTSGRVPSAWCFGAGGDVNGAGLTRHQHRVRT